VDNAKKYEFWDNNGRRNYVVTRRDLTEVPTGPTE
jgi:hypothetical protein